MALRRNVGLKAFRYRGGGPMLVWALHRIGGLAIIIFVSLHVVSSFFMQQTGSDFATTLNIIYESIYFQVFIYFFVIFHALNGFRIILMDFWPQLAAHQHQLISLQWIIFLVVYGLTVFIMIQNAISSAAQAA